MPQNFDLFVIGGGSGGVRAARLAAEKGLRVGLAEGRRLGGTCVIRGCVPKKLMRYASGFGEMIEGARGFGWQIGEARFDWPQFQARLAAELDRLEAIYRNLLENAGVEIFDHYASLAASDRVRLDDRELAARRILIATGGEPVIPNIEGGKRGDARLLTSDDIFELKTLPERLAIIGGGYIALEFASILNAMGVRIELLYRGDLILRGHDEAMRRALAQDMKRQGVEIHHNALLRRIDAQRDAIRLECEDGRQIESDAVLFATGRQANTRRLGLERLGVKTRGEDQGAGYIAVDEYSATNITNIHAIGDVTGRAGLTPVAIREAVNLISTLYEGEPRTLDYSLIPTAVFTFPELGTIGLSEEAARETGVGIDIYETDFSPMQEHFAKRENRMRMKIIASQESGRLLGIHILGEGAAEMIQLAAIPFGMGARWQDFAATLPLHPTAAEELITMKKRA